MTIKNTNYIIAERIGNAMKIIEEYAKYSLILMGLMATGWAVCVVGLGALGVL